MRSRKIKRRREDAPDLRERICEALDIVPDTLPRAATVEIRGRNYMSIRECGRILLYTPEKIAVELPDSTLCIVGRRLVCTSYSSGAVRIDGYISAVCFEEG